MSGKEFKQLLDQATSSTSGSEPNWESITKIVEMVQLKEVVPKKASQEIRKKLLEVSESTVLNALYLVDSVVKNTPSAVHKDFLSPELLGSLKAIIEGQDSGMAKAIDKALEMLGEWKAAFGDDSNYKVIQTIFNELEKGGYYIPEAQLASASYMQKPPTFQESDKCYLCTKEFGKGLYKGRHHCRNCGKSICNKCMGDTPLALPHFGIGDPQKLCITCYKKIDKPSEQSESSNDNIPSEFMLGNSSPQPPQTSDREIELQEEDDLQMAIAISLNEEENKKKTSSSTTASSFYSSNPPKSTPQTSTQPTAPVPSLYTPLYADLDFSGTTSTIQTSHDQHKDTNNLELQKYLNYGKEQKEKIVSQQRDQHLPTQTTTVVEANGDIHPPLCKTLRQLVEHFTQRMHEVNSKGRSIATDPAILSMHQDLTAMNLQLLQQIDETQEKKAEQERILHKLEEAKEARVTLDTMRRRHEEHLVQQEREQQALAQMQVQMKLALLRQQKAEELAYGHTMQNERLGRLNNQREEYKRLIASQREFERQQLIVQEQQVFQQQFGTNGPSKPMETNPYAPVETNPYGPVETNPYAPVETTPYGSTGIGYTHMTTPMSTGPSVQPSPLPQKVDPPPPPYQPPPSLYQPNLFQPAPIDTTEYHFNPVPPPVPTYPTPHDAQYVPSGPTHQQQGYVPSLSSGVPLYQPTVTQPPLTAPPPPVAPTTYPQRPPSEPPLISFD